MVVFPNLNLENKGIHECMLAGSGTGCRGIHAGFEVVWFPLTRGGSGNLTGVGARGGRLTSLDAS